MPFFCFSRETKRISCLRGGVPPKGDTPMWLDASQILKKYIRVHLGMRCKFYGKSLRRSSAKLLQCSTFWGVQNHTIYQRPNSAKRVRAAPPIYSQEIMQQKEEIRKEALRAKHPPGPCVFESLIKRTKEDTLQAATNRCHPQDPPTNIYVYNKVNQPPSHW